MCLDFDLDYNLISVPQLLHDQGVGSIKIINFNLSLHLVPYNKNGSIQFEFRDAIIDIEDYQVDFKGSSEISKAFQIVVYKFKDFFKNELVNIISRKITKSVEQSLNELMVYNQVLKPLDKYPGLLLNFTFTQNPII